MWYGGDASSVFLALEGHFFQLTKSLENAALPRPRMRVLTLLWFIANLSALVCAGFSVQERRELRDDAKKLFTHAYDNYKKHALPKDVLAPLSCKGVNGWGNISLTLIDTLDTLAIMNNKTEFEWAVKWTIEHVSFDVDETVSLFETNIRALGGLLSAHTFASDPALNLMQGGYDGGLLKLAVELADRLLPALNTRSGIPFGSVNLKWGVAPHESRETCTAAAGTLVLEFGALSRLTGDVRYEAAALRAARALWRRRSAHGLLGAHINIETGKWTQLESGIGRGIDSYYEYMLKGHLLLGGSEYLAMFHDSYKAAIRMLKHGPWYVDSNTHTGQITWPLFNSLQCFWPGMQMLAGESEYAVGTLRAFHSLWLNLGYHPEGFNLQTMKVQKGQEGYPLRPEHVESLFYTHRATNGDEWIEAGRDVMESLKKLRVDCGVAALKDITTRKKEDAMESYFLSETVKYLYLLFDPDDDVYSHGRYVFTTEAHPLPLILGTLRPGDSLEESLASNACLGEARAWSKLTENAVCHNRNASSYFNPEVEDSDESARALAEFGTWPVEESDQAVDFSVNSNQSGIGLIQKDSIVLIGSCSIPTQQVKCTRPYCTLIVSL